MTRPDQDAPAEATALAELDLSPELELVLQAALERKARDLLLLDLRPVSNATDFFVIMTGTSDIHVRSIAEHIVEQLKGAGFRPNHVEGLRGGHWVLLDFIDFVVHIFHPAAREFYQLERLWGDAPAYPVEG